MEATTQVRLTRVTFLHGPLQESENAHKWCQWLKSRGPGTEAWGTPCNMTAMYRDNVHLVHTLVQNLFSCLIVFTFVRRVTVMLTEFHISHVNKTSSDTSNKKEKIKMNNLFIYLFLIKLSTGSHNLGRKQPEAALIWHPQR